MSWMKVDNDGMVWVNESQVTEVRPFSPGEHKCQITLACGTKHELNMTCEEFLAGIRCHKAHEHNE